VLEAGRVNGPSCNLKVDLDVYVRRPGMSYAAPRTEQLGHQTTKEDELGRSPIVVHDTYKSLLGSAPSCS
jgi:hypothetical protein